MASTSKLPKFQGKKRPAPVAARRKPNTEELLSRKAEAELSCKTLEDSLAVCQQKCFDLLKEKKAEKLGLEEKLQKTALLKSRSSMSQNQVGVCNDLTKRAEKINKKLACRLEDEVGSPEPSFVFNPNAKALECAKLASIKKCLEEGEKNPELFRETVKNFSGDERLKAVMELQRDVQQDLAQLVGSIDVDKDARKLSEQLLKSEMGELALVSLDEHLKRFTILNTRSVLEEQELLSENRQLQRELKELLQNNPEMRPEIEALLEAEQVKELEQKLQQLILETQDAAAVEQQQERSLNKILSLNSNLETLRGEVMKGLSTLEDISRHQQMLMDEMQSLGQTGKDLSRMLEIEGLLSALIKQLYAMPLAPLAIQPEDADLCGIKNLVQQKGALEQTEMQLEHHSKASKAEFEEFRKFKADAGKVKDSLMKCAVEVQHSVCKAQNLCLDHANAPSELKEKLQTLKSAPVESKLAEDTERRVCDLSLQDWIELFKENYPEINHLD